MKKDEESKIKYFNRVYDNIQNLGYHTTSVAEEKDFTPFTYSTGIYKNFKIPELFISGLGPNLSTEIIKSYVEKYKFDEVPLNTKIDNLDAPFSVYFIKLNTIDLTAYTLTSIKFYENSHYEYVQLIFPDLNGNFPNESKYDYDQKIIGKFSIKQILH